MTRNIGAERLDIDPDLIEQTLEEMASATKKKRRSRREDDDDDARYIRVPLSFVRDVCLLTRGRNALAVALCVYRRVRICRSRTVTLPGTDLTELDIDRHRKHEALIQLQSAGLIKVKTEAGRAARVTLLWRPG